MAEINLSNVIPLPDEKIGNGQTDYGKIINRLFKLLPYQVVGGSGTITPQASDFLVLQPGTKYLVGTCIEQQITSPRLKTGSSGDDESLERVDFEVDIADRQKPAFLFRRNVDLVGVTLIDKKPISNAPEFIRLIKSDSANVVSTLSIVSAAYEKTSPLIVCEHDQIILQNCSFSGEGTVLVAQNTCTSVTYQFNLNHGDCRAIKITSPSCQVNIQNNTIDIGSQLLWQEGDVRPDSIIALNSVQGHRAGLDNLAENGHIIYIKGGVGGLEVSRNTFSGADCIDGDVSGINQVDRSPDRPDNHIKICAPAGKKITNLKITKNQLRFARLTSISIEGALESSYFRYNNFSGVSGTGTKCACYFPGTADITGCEFNSNLMTAENGTTADLFNFNNRKLTRCIVRSNLVCTPGETVQNVAKSETDSSNVIRRNMNE